MKEELYIIRNSKRHKIDLLQPSGITLCFNSNIFNDLSKIDCSKTYTFKLPNTATNAKAFDLVGDLRYPSALYGLRIPCELWVDGVPIVGNLYVSELNNGTYSAVMTFAAVEGLQAINDDDVDICDLGAGEEITFGWETSSRNAGSIATYCAASNFTNARAQTPLYSAGVPMYRDGSEAFYRISDSESSASQRPLMPPVMPLYAIVQKIQTYYGVTFDFFPSYAYSDLAADIAGGVTPAFQKVAGIPLVTTILGEQYEEEQNMQFNNVTGVSDVSYTFTDRDLQTKTFEAQNQISFSSVSFSADADFLACYGTHCGAAFKTLCNNVSLRLGGSLYVSFNEANELETPPRLIIAMYSIRGETILDEIEAQYDDVNSTAGNQIYFWDFRETEGFTPHDVEGVPTRGLPIVLRLDDVDVPDTFTSCDLMVYPHFEDGIMGHKIRVYDCLPDLSAMQLMKSIYYILGGFPKVNTDGSLGISYFTDIRDNLTNGNVYDWSDCALIDYGADPATLKFTNGNLGIENYLLMRNESTDEQETSKTDDIYGSPLFSFTCANKVLDKAKTLHQFPFYGRFIQNGTHHSLATGDTIKYWSVDNNIARASEAKPAIGTFDIDADSGLLTFSVWQTDDANENYTYLQSILSKPYVVKIPVRVALADLAAIDYTRPVYIAQLNAYFAIMQVVVSTNGETTAELIKLP